MTSIKTKLFWNITGLIIFFVLISWGLSALFLEDFYIRQKKRSIIENAQAIENLYKSSTQNFSLELERIGESLGAGIIILSPEGLLKYSSFERILNRSVADRSSAPLQTQDTTALSTPPPPPRFIVKSTENVDGNSVIELGQDQPLNINFIQLKRRLHNNDILEMRLPLAAVSESALYAGHFMALTGLLTIFLGSFWAFLFARRFTVPLLELNNVAKSISQLDFSQKCHNNSADEVGQLGRSINDVSYQLNKAISELNEKNQQLAADVEKERGLDKLRRNFISSVSHELKTPISLVLGYAEGLKENVAQDDDSKNYYCSVIMDEAAKMDRLVKDLLDLSQIESGYFRLSKTEFDLSSLLEEIILKFQTVLSEKNITLTIEETSPVIVNGDIFRIEQIIVNLLNNAIKHTDGKHLILIRLVEGKDKVRVYVYNTGKHIPADSLDNLWLSFYKVDSARTREMGGYGLGLSIVRAIQELHGNQYGVENADGGVIFWFELDHRSSEN